MQKALAFEVAREKNMSPEKVYEICKSFHDGLRELMSKPDKCRKGIIVEGFLTLNFRRFKLEKRLYNNTQNIELKKRILENLQK
jgi:hypothetical protein